MVVAAVWVGVGARSGGVKPPRNDLTALLLQNVSQGQAAGGSKHLEARVPSPAALTASLEPQSQRDIAVSETAFVPSPTSSQ